jgi:quercetin dioxygenase-like cupin family protein
MAHRVPLKFNNPKKGELIMKRLTYLIMSVLLVALALGFAVETATAAEKMSTKAGDVKVLLDNDKVRVVRAVRPPGTVVPMHTHPTLVAYYFDATTVKLTSPEGKSKVKDIPAGKLIWFPNGVTHALEVIGPADQNVLVIEIKK